MFVSLNIPVCRFLIVALATVLFSGCASAPATVDTSPEAEVTFDGLHPVEGAKMQQVWARDDFDLSPYSKIMLRGAASEFRPGGKNPKMHSSLGPNEHYTVTPEQKAKFDEIMGEAFVAELSSSEQFSIVTEPGPDVLLVQGKLLDVVSFIPDDRMSRGGRESVRLSRVGEVTLVLEIRDSESSAILIRAAERRAAESAALTMTRSNPVTNAAEFRRVATHWAKILREGLDRLLTPGDPAGE